MGLDSGIVAVAPTEPGRRFGDWNVMAVKQKKGLRAAQARLRPKDDLQPYKGRWVALRRGHVIADEKSAKALRAHPEVKSSDAIVPVSASHGGYFVA